jgi:16S rRNA (cytosine1402-N4)-methyltransferase
LNEDVLPKHISVLREEALEFLNLKPGCVVVDATVGLGGHSKEILKRILPGGKLVAIDQDEKALETARKNLAEYKDHVQFLHGNFSDLVSLLKNAGVDSADALLMDLGVSSYQLSNPERGFSFLEDGPLDMRMNLQQDLQAKDVVNSSSEKDLADIIFQYGEERLSRRIAGAIVDARRKQRFQTTMQLADVIERAVGRFYRKQKIHPATRTFQALRIYVNRELDCLEKVLREGVHILKPGGRWVVISFHSLEDGKVKRAFRDVLALRGGSEGGQQLVKVLTKKPVRPSLKEIESNSRARSAKLRAVEKI